MGIFKKQTDKLWKSCHLGVVKKCWNIQCTRKRLKVIWSVPPTIKTRKASEQRASKSKRQSKLKWIKDILQETLKIINSDKTKITHQLTGDTETLKLYVLIIFKNWAKISGKAMLHISKLSPAKEDTMISGSRLFNTISAKLNIHCSDQSQLQWRMCSCLQTHQKNVYFKAWTLPSHVHVSSSEHCQHKGSLPSKFSITVL